MLAQFSLTFGLVVVLTGLLGPATVTVTSADTNILSGANDIIVARDLDGKLQATPFSVQFGKKDIWLPRSGHVVKMKLNGEPIDMSMVLDSVGHAYFSTKQTARRDYNFWTALFGVSDPPAHQMSHTATSEQLESLNLSPGQNSIDFEVDTGIGSHFSIPASIFLVDRDEKIVISDVDGTITKSNLRGFVLPALGISDWKHNGVVALYRAISERGYLMIYLSARPIGQADTTRDYIYSLREGNETMPIGAVFLRKDSLVNAVATEVIKGNPEVAKIATLARIRGVLAGPAGQNMFAAYGNQQTDINAYKALNISLDRIYRVDEYSWLSRESDGTKASFEQHFDQLATIYPLLD